MIESYFAKLKEYLRMDTEISYEEFDAYYREVISYLQANFETMTKDEYIKARYMMKILAVNAGERSRRKNTVAKKYKKIWEKAEFWVGAIDYRLKILGMSPAEIDSTHEAFNQEI